MAMAVIEISLLTDLCAESAALNRICANIPTILAQPLMYPGFIQNP
jgi:hypothetical protein